MKNNNAVIIEPRTGHRASVIWLHGLGADGHDFEPIVPELRLPEAAGVKFIFPHAPVRKVTINGGMSMRAWYDIRTPDLDQQEDEVSIRDSAQIINSYITGEIALGIEPKKIIIAGFSQGGAITLHTGLRFPETLAGLLVLSAYLPLAEVLEKEAHEANRKIPVLMLHGTHDPVIPISLGKNSHALLLKNGYTVDWKSYPMPHAVCPEEISDIGLWLTSRLS